MGKYCSEGRRKRRLAKLKKKREADTGAAMAVEKPGDTPAKP
jgi:hypothetical protein